MEKKNILVYGATGSIGDSVFSLLRENKDVFKVTGITCDNNVLKLKKIAEEFNPNYIGIADYQKNIEYKKLFPNKKLFFGLNEFVDLMDKQVDIIILATSGLAVLDLSLKIMESGKIVGLANKECIISLGDIFSNIAKKNNTTIIPLDSEHNAIHQILNKDNNGLKSITLTATGGPFLNKKISDLANISPADAIKHPIWKMGKKISVDSATMMNKSLEIIEAKYLFNLKNDEINALIHPEAIVHGLVTYRDNSMISFMSCPDMKIPISNLLFPNREASLNELSIDLSEIKTLNFYSIDHDRFPAIKYCHEVLNLGGLAPCGFNYANEKLVNLFLKNKIRFLDIVQFNINTLDKFFAKNNNILYPATEDINNFNEWIDNNIYLGE